MEERLETPKQLAARVGLKEQKIRRLIRSCQIEHVHIPVGAFARFIEVKKVPPCQEKTTDPVFVGRNCFYITWSEHGRSRERSTGTSDSKKPGVR